MSKQKCGKRGIQIWEAAKPIFFDNEAEKKIVVKYLKKAVIPYFYVSGCERNK